MNKEYITLNELAKSLKISGVTINCWRKEGILYYKIGNVVWFIEGEVNESIALNKI